MSLRNRIVEIIQKVFSSRIECTQGNVLIGREASGTGFTSEIVVGDGLDLTGGNLTATGSIPDSVNHIPFAITPSAVPTAEGTVSWNPTDHTLNLQTEVLAVIQQVGQELLVPVKNNTGAKLDDGTAVAITGSTGDRMTVEKAIATSDVHANSFIGIVTADIASSGEGYVTVFGRVRGLDTNSLTPEGSVVWLSAVTAGALTVTKPTSPAWAIKVGTVEKKAGSPNGRIFVSPQRMSVSSSEVVDASPYGSPNVVVLYGDDGGVTGRTADGFGVYGFATGSGRGVFGTCNSGYGVYGSSGDNIGVCGESDFGIGVKGSGGANGVYGYSVDGIGVFGDSTGVGVGVKGQSVDGTGVYGSSSTFTGTFGVSESGTGVFGGSTTGVGVHGEGGEWGGKFGTGALDQNAIQVFGNTYNVLSQRTISSSSATGRKGDICHDSSYTYTCIATNTWVRTPHVPFTYKRHVQLDAKADGNVANQPTQVDFSSSNIPVAGLQFSQTGTKNSFCQFEVPDDWAGTDIVLEIDWLADSGNIGATNVKWVMQFIAVAEGESVNQAATTPDPVTVTNKNQWITVHSGFTIPAASIAKQDHVFVRFYRDNTVASNFTGTVTSTAYEMIYDSVGFPTSN